MHGTIIGEMKKFVNEEYGRGTFADLLEDTGMGGMTFSPSETYPDEDVMSILQSALETTGKSINELLEDFGEFIGPSLIEMYSGLIDPDWDVLDFIENTEETIHTEVKKRTSGAQPPDLGDTERLSEEELILHYQSERRMCGLAKGIARAVAEHFDDTITISESECMLEGGNECELHFTKL